MCIYLSVYLYGYLAIRVYRHIRHNNISILIFKHIRVQAHRNRGLHKDKCTRMQVLRHFRYPGIKAYGRTNV